MGLNAKLGLRDFLKKVIFMPKTSIGKGAIIQVLKLNLIFLIREITRQFFRLTPESFPRLIEKAAADAQGKGYGSTSIRQEVEVISRLLGKRPQLAIDIGGNIGDYTAELRRRNQNLEIHTFEPADVNVKKLKTKFSNDSLVSIVSSAVSNKSGSATLYSDVPGSGLGSLSKRNLDHFGIAFNNEQDISVIRFEDYWKNELSSRQIDIVKLDIEGHELAALEGFGEAIYSTSIIQFEFGGCNIDTRTFFHDFWEFFNRMEFDIFRINPHGVSSINIYREIDEFFLTTNYVAKNRCKLISG